VTRRRRPTPKAKPWEPFRFSHVAEHGGKVYGNDRYTVTLHELYPDDDPDHIGPSLTVLGIHTHTRSAIGAHDWRHFQRIKNELCGPEREGVELYPAESRLVDSANEFWVWVLPAGERFPFGFADRNIGGPNPEPHRERWRQRRST
jgi:hypothetical protein